MFDVLISCVIRGIGECNKCIHFHTYSPLKQTSSLTFLFVLFCFCTQQYRNVVFVQNRTGSDYFYRIVQGSIICTEQYREVLFLYRIIQGRIICTEQYRDILFLQNSTRTYYLYRIVQGVIIVQNSTGTFYLYREVQGYIICTEQYRDVLFAQNSTGIYYSFRIVQGHIIFTEQYRVGPLGTRQLGTCQIRHRLIKQTRHLLNSAPVKFGTQFLQIRHLRFANSAPDF